MYLSMSGTSPGPMGIWQSHCANALVRATHPPSRFPNAQTCRASARTCSTSPPRLRTCTSPPQELFRTVFSFCLFLPFHYSLLKMRKAAFYKGFAGTVPTRSWIPSAFRHGGRKVEVRSMLRAPCTERGGSYANTRQRTKELASAVHLPIIPFLTLTSLISAAQSDIMRTVDTQ